MPTPYEPSEMTPKQRRKEIAKILAKGLERWLKHAAKMPHTEVDRDSIIEDPSTPKPSEPRHPTATTPTPFPAR